MIQWGNLNAQSGTVVTMPNTYNSFFWAFTEIGSINGTGETAIYIINKNSFGIKLSIGNTNISWFAIGI